MWKATDVLKKEFAEGKYQERLQDIYLDEHQLDAQRDRYIKALEEFEKLYGVKEVEIYSAPGRSEVGGNHTDHQLGMVLATSINLDAIAIVAKTGDNKVTIKSEGYKKEEVSSGRTSASEGRRGYVQRSDQRYGCPSERGRLPDWRFSGLRYQ